MNQTPRSVPQPGNAIAMLIALGSGPILWASSGGSPSDFLPWVLGGSPVGPASPKRLSVAEQSLPQPTNQVPYPVILSALMAALSDQESGGNYSAVNPDAATPEEKASGKLVGALGRWQVMHFNVASWSKSALGRSITPEEFLYNPQAQDAIVRHRLNSYLQQTLVESGGNLEIAVRMAAVCWYAGAGQKWNYDNPQPQYSSGTQYPSLRNYSLSVWDKVRWYIQKGYV